MKQVWTVFVFFWYIYGIDKLLIIRAEQKTLHWSEVPDIIACANPAAVIQVEKVDIVGEKSICSKKCVLTTSDLQTITEKCNDANECTVDFPNNTDCLRENRYFNLSYLCAVPANMACNFEFSLCHWRSVSYNDVIWKTYSPHLDESQRSLPNTDHTTNSNKGFYMYMKRYSPQRRVAVVKSGNISFNGNKCFEFWYNMDDSHLRIYKSTFDINRLLLWENTNSLSSWQHVNVSIEITDSPYEIVIEGTVGTNNNAYIAIDDTDIRDWSCDASQPVSCNFEEDFCNFRRELEYDHPWEIINTGDTGGRPSFDHTKKENGHYVYRELQNYVPKQRHRFFIPFQNVLEEGCLSFWYFMYGKNPGHLDIYTVVNMKPEILSFIFDTRTLMWSRFQVSVYNVTQIIFEYNATDLNHGGIALDDVYISPITCEDKQISDDCVKHDAHLHIQCPVDYIWNETIAFDPKIHESCMTTSDKIHLNLLNKLMQCNNITMCTFTPAELIDDKMCLSMEKRVLLDYSCIDKSVSVTSSPQTVSSTLNMNETTVFTTLVKQTISTSQQNGGTSFFTTLDRQPISTSQQTGDIKDGNQSSSPSSTPVIGIVVGVLLSLIALSVVLVIAVIYFRRYRYSEKKGHSIVANEDIHSDYTGHQNTAFSPEVNVTSQTDYCEIRTSKHNDQYHDISDVLSPSIHTTNDDEYSEIANVVNSPNNNPNPSTNYQHQYISLDPNATGFDRSIPQNNLHNESKNNHINSSEMTSFTGSDDYAILDPDDLNESKNNTPKVLPLSDNYVVLDPNETGFNRQESTDTACNYELATPINPTETSEDPYDVSKDETYDTSSNNRHKEKENNIYSHTVDNVYDTAGNQRKKEESDATYDHFFGQQSEDDYDISKPL